MLEEAILLSEEEFGNAYVSGFCLTSRFLQSQGLLQELAEEIAQDAWCRGWARRSELREHRAVVYWINTIALNLMYRHFQRKKWPEHYFTPQQQPADFESPIIVAEILARCTEQDREVLVRFYMEGYSSEEIAAAMGIHPTTVRVRMMRAKRALRALVSFPNYSPSLA